MDMCGDNRFEIIGKAKNDILEATNINTSPDEMNVLDNLLFRCWQMGWLNKYDNSTFGVIKGMDKLSLAHLLLSIYTAKENNDEIFADIFKSLESVEKWMDTPAIP